VSAAAPAVPRPLTARRRAEACSDPLLHALVAAAVAAPLAPRGGRGPVLTAVAAGTLIDLDHPLVARSLRLGDMISLDSRPRSHSVVVAVTAGALATAAAGPLHGWATFGGLLSHLLRDADDDSAPTPLLWPWPTPRAFPPAALIAGTAALAAGSWAISRAAGAGGARGGGARRRRAA
jgi:membrane-bound metal-dependent hydrolase YbcI (DUF457 family)